MVGLKITIESAGVERTLLALEEPVRQEALESIGMLLKTRTQDNIAARSGPGGPWPTSSFDGLYAGPRIWRDISRSVTYAADAAKGTIAIGATHIAAPVRQLGTVGAGGTEPDIVPVKKKALAIPISDAASKASYAGIPAREAFPDAFMLKSSHGASALGVGVLVRYVGGRTNKKTGQKQGQKLEELYLICQRARIRPHPFLPITQDGQLQEGLWGDIETLVTDNFLQA